MELVSPGGSGFSVIDQFSCTLIRFDKVRNGGKLPSVVVPFEGNITLAGKLFDLLEKGGKKGGLGVKLTESNNPGCCDRISTTSYAIATLKRRSPARGAAAGSPASREAECTFVQNARTDPGAR